MMQRKAHQFPQDPMIIPRVKQYLEENVHQTYVDVAVMARDLQQRYREYYRRKAGVFRLLVEEAYRTVLRSYGLDDSNPSSDNDDEAASDVEVMDEMANSRAQMNNTLASLYMNNRNDRQLATGGKSQATAGAALEQMGEAGQEAIDISSDEEEQADQTGQADGGRTGGDKSNFVQTFVTSNKHITVTKVTRSNARGDDESSNGSATGTDAGGTEGAEKNQPASKRRRLDDAQSGGLGGLTQPLRNNSKSKQNADNANVRLLRMTHKPGGRDRATPNDTGASGQRGGKKYRKEITPHLVDTTFEDIGGMDRILKNLCELLLHVKHPEVYRHVGLPAPRGFLLHGPPGSGKTLLAQAIAGQLKIELIEIPATELIAGVSGESEERIRDVFEQAAANAPCVLFIDEIDAISSNRINAQRDMERRIVAQLLSSLDSLGKLEGGEGVIVIGATNRADALDPALRRVGRFDQEISLGIPDRAARMQILKIICRKLKLADTIDFGELAKLTPGYVGADLLALATRAANMAIKRLFTEQKKHIVSKVLLDESSDDVVALDDETDEVVNIDDDKEDDADNQPETAPLTMNGEKKDAAVVDTTDRVEQQPSPAKKDCEKQTDPNEAAPVAGSTSEPVSSTEEPKEKQVPSAAAGEEVVGEAEKMIVEATSTPVSGGSPVVAAAATEKPTDEEAKKKSGDDKPQSSTTNGPAGEETLAKEREDNEPTTSTTDDTERAMEVEEENSAETSNEKLSASSKGEATLGQMMELLLNQQNTLPPADLDRLCIERDDFMEALRTVQPSAKREGFITVPDVTWNDIGSLGDIREELKLAILAPVKFPQRLRTLGLNAPSGVLLCGPPGCGKTLLAKAVANEAGINFISVKGPELLNMYVGESERAVRQCFQRARNSAPCVIFFDEFDSLCPKRSDTAEGSAATRVVNQLLTEMDGIEERKGVFLMAATNRPDIVDPAVLRPGRLDKILYVGLPALADRVDILRALTKNRTQPPLAADVEFEKVAQLTEGYTGADLAGLVRQASLQTLKDSIVACGDEEKADDGEQSHDPETLSLTVTLAHFLEAIRNIKPSVGIEDKKHYEKLRLKYGTGSLS